MKSIVLDVRGMHCTSCEMLIQGALEELGIQSEVSHKKGRVSATFDENHITENQIKEVIVKEGFEVKT
jgi:copper chaperone CopZ